jgi:hypothetical protein
MGQIFKMSKSNSPVTNKLPKYLLPAETIEADTVNYDTVSFAGMTIQNKNLLNRRHSGGSRNPEKGKSI